MTYKILLSRALPIPPLRIGGQPIEVCVYERDAHENENAQVYCTTALDKADAVLINSLPDSVGLIANIGVGTDNIDLKAVQAKGITVSNTPVVTEDTADLAFALILSAARRISANEKFVRAGQWSSTKPLAAMGQSVHGKTLGILGFGAIGQAVARRAKGFNMNIIYHGPNQKPEAEADLGAKYAGDLQTFLSQIDILSLHCPLSTQTKYILGKDTLAHLQKGAIVVNTGRGALIDESALVAALESGQVGAAGLDVFEHEPDIHPGLLEMSNVTLTPHIGSATDECRTQMAMRAIGNILNFLEHGHPIDSVTL